MSAQVDRFRTKETNPRGIPQAKFIDKIEDLISASSATVDDDLNILLKECQNRLSQYKYMEESKRNSLKNLNIKIPDIEKTLSICEFLKSKKGKSEEDNDDEDEDEDDDEDKNTLEVNYELNDTLYTTAVIDTEKLDSVNLWLGANVMLEYPLQEAIDLLKQRLSIAETSKDTVLEDLDYLRSNITTMEVNTARIYNWDVNRRKALKQ